MSLQTPRESSFDLFKSFTVAKISRARRLICFNPPPSLNLHLHSLHTNLPLSSGSQFHSFCYPDFFCCSVTTAVKQLYVCTKCACFISALQGQVEHAGDTGDEPVAGAKSARHRGLGRGLPSRQGLATLRGPRTGHHHQRQRQVGVYACSCTTRKHSISMLGVS